MKEAQAIERLRQVLRRQHKVLAMEDAYVLTALVTPQN